MRRVVPRSAALVALCLGLLLTLPALIQPDGGPSVPDHDHGRPLTPAELEQLPGEYTQEQLRAWFGDPTGDGWLESFVPEAGANNLYSNPPQKNVCRMVGGVVVHRYYIWDAAYGWWMQHNWMSQPGVVCSEWG